MTQKDLADSLKDILEEIGAIERFTAKVNFENFVQNEEKCFAVEKALEIIGGSQECSQLCSQRLSRNFLEKYSGHAR